MTTTTTTTARPPRVEISRERITWFQPNGRITHPVAWCVNVDNETVKIAGTKRDAVAWCAENGYEAAR